MDPRFECRQSGSKNWTTERHWEDWWEIKLEGKAGDRHADHVKDFEQKSVQIQGC